MINFNTEFSDILNKHPPEKNETVMANHMLCMINTLYKAITNPSALVERKRPIKPVRNIKHK